MMQTSANYQRQASNENFISDCTHFYRSSDSYSGLLRETVLEVLETQLRDAPRAATNYQIIAPDKQLDSKL